MKSGEVKTINRKRALLANQVPYISDYFNLKKDVKYFIQIIVNFNCISIKEQLTPFDLGSLKGSYIKIFHGRLTARKTPLVVN